MNRSILLVVCDFLVLSMLAMISFDGPRQSANKAAATQEVAEAVSTDVSSELMDMLHATLESEREAKDVLTSELEKTRQTLENRDQELTKSRSQLDDVTKALNEKETIAEALEAQKQQLAEERERLRQRTLQLSGQRDELEQRVAASQLALSSAERARQGLEQERAQLAENLAKIEREATEAKERASRLAEEQSSITGTLTASREEAAVAKERLKQLQEEMQRQQAALASAQAEKERVEVAKREAELERNKLQTELAVSNTRLETLVQNLDSARSEIQTVRSEKDRLMNQTAELAQGVKQVAEQSGRIADTIKEAQPISSNEIYDRHRKNAVRLRFTGTNNTLFGSREFETEVRSIFATDGKRTFILAHREATPFGGTTAPDKVQARAIVNGKNYNVNHISFLANDPRIIAIDVDPNLPQQAGVEAFYLETELFRFSEAVLVANQEDKFGETKFTLDPEANLDGGSSYLKMDSRVLSKLFGNFAPSQGDLVFSKSGGVIGIMGNHRYATRIDAFLIGEKIDLGTRYNSAVVGTTLNRLQLATNRLPFAVR